MINSNGGQFVIAGMVSEGIWHDADGSAHSLCLQHGQHIMMNGLIAFRDGVTIQLAEASGGEQPIFYCTTDPIDTSLQRSLALNEQAIEVFSIGRIAALPISCLEKKVSNVVGAGTEPTAFQAVVRKSMVGALTTGSDALLNRAAWVFANPGSC